MGAYMDFDRTADKSWAPAQYLVQFGLYVSERTTAANAAEVEALRAALREVVNLWDHHASAHGDGVIYPLHQAARAALDGAQSTPQPADASAPTP